MDKRYQVFVSSTFQDLEAERQEVMHALLELDCIPSGMELFPAANETQWSLIQKVIDDCDYYLLVLGGRYGSIGPDGISYTEMEYRYALSIGKPVISFLHKDPGKIPMEKAEQTDAGKEKLAAFRALVEKKLCKHWESPEQLGSVVSRSLVQLIKSTPVVGWVRADGLADNEATAELLKLRRRVEELESELQRSRTSAPKGSEALAQGDEEHSVKFSFKSVAPEEWKTLSWSSSFSPTWDEMFSAIAPLMIDEASESEFKHALDNMAELHNIDALSGDPDLKDHSLSSFRISPEEFQKIKVQLRALGLIVKNERNRSVKDRDTYWTLTPYGDEVMTRLLAIRHNDEELFENDGVEKGGDD